MVEMVRVAAAGPGVDCRLSIVGSTERPASFDLRAIKLCGEDHRECQSVFSL